MNERSWFNEHPRTLKIVIAFSFLEPCCLDVPVLHTYCLGAREDAQVSVMLIDLTLRSTMTIAIMFLYRSRLYF